MDTPDYVPDPTAALAIIPNNAPPAGPRFALVEIFGHRQHYGEVREVEAFGAKLLEVADIDTGKRHRYGGAAIFSMTDLTEDEINRHVQGVEAQRKFQAEYNARWNGYSAEADDELAAAG